MTPNERETAFQEAYDRNDWNEMWNIVQEVVTYMTKAQLKGVHLDEDTLNQRILDATIRIMSRIRQGVRPQKLSSFCFLIIRNVLYDPINQEADREIPISYLSDDKQRCISQGNSPSMRRGTNVSNRTKRVKKNITKSYQNTANDLYGSTIGSIVVSLGMTNKYAESECIEIFKHLKSMSKNDEFKPSNLIEAIDFIADYMEINEETKKYLYLFYDEGNVYTPIVSNIIVDELGDEKILPLRSDGIYTGCLSHINCGRIKREKIYGGEI